MGAVANPLFDDEALNPHSHNREIQKLEQRLNEKAVRKDEGAF